MNREPPCGKGRLPGANRHAALLRRQINPGDATTTLGLLVDSRARVLDEASRPIPGLYACGLDMNSLWRGVPPGNGAN